MITIPQSYREIDAAASVLYLSLHIETAVQIFQKGSIPVMGDMLLSNNLIGLGVSIRAAPQVQGHSNYPPLALRADL